MSPIKIDFYTYFGQQQVFVLFQPSGWEQINVDVGLEGFGITAADWVSYLGSL